MKAEARILSLYERYHRPEFIHPDPLELVLRYNEPAEREIAGFLAAAFAIGRVACILQTVEYLLEKLPRPLYVIEDIPRRELEGLFPDFRYRFYGKDDLVDLLSSVGRCLRRHGSLKACFCSFTRASDETVLPALSLFVEELRKGIGSLPMLSSPENGSACKRSLLFLRWMVRKDAIDPGGWDEVLRSSLVIPVDTHMLKAAQAFGLTERRQADLKAALEITEALKRIDPEDPVRFDFSLTRPGIHPRLSEEDEFREGWTPMRARLFEMNGRMAIKYLQRR
jgi:uncharacterized protein (TIGR02757 family)